MKNVILAIQSLLKSAIEQNNSPLEWIKRVYFGDPVLIPLSSLPALTVQPITSEYLMRWSRYDQKKHTVEIRLVYNMKSYFGSEAGSEVAISGGIWANSAITFTSAAHGLIAGDEIEVKNSSPQTFNWTYEIVSATVNAFVVAKVSNPGTYVWSAVFQKMTVEKVFNIEDAIHKIEEADYDHETAEFSVCGVIQNNPELPFVDPDGNPRKASQLAQVRSVNYSFSDVRGFPTFEVTTTVEVTAIGDR